MGDTTASGRDLQDRLARVETNYGWIKAMGTVAAMGIIAALGWLNVQSANHGERLARLEAEVKAGFERNAAAIERNAAAIERNAATLERNAATLERNAATLELIEAHLAE